jgi:hypothetical protein
VMPVFYARDYSANLVKFKKNISDLSEDQELAATVADAGTLLWDNKRTIDMYCNYLTHTDLAPSNFRIYGKKIYLLDLSSMAFGNKYEGWARFLNWATIHSPELEKLLTDYVKKNRAEEYGSLRMMRIYKAVLLIEYYVRSLGKTAGDLHKLTEERINFWHEILKYILEDKQLPEGFIEEYKSKRNQLRSEEEKRRQKDFNLV